jgi:hypothetical protein
MNFQSTAMVERSPRQVVRMEFPDFNLTKDGDRMLLTELLQKAGETDFPESRCRKRAATRPNHPQDFHGFLHGGAFERHANMSK